MTTAIALIVVAVLIATFSYFTNAGFGDRKPKTKKNQPSDPDDKVPPPNK